MGEEIYSFDREHIEQLAQNGASLEELTDAVLHDMKRFLTPEQLLRIADSGNGALEHVGIKVDACAKCPLEIHIGFVHGVAQGDECERGALIEQAVACARNKLSTLIEKRRHEVM